MKTHILIITLASILVMLAGCGSSGSSDSAAVEGDTTSKQVYSKVGEEVNVQTGDSIVPLSSDTQVAISSNSGDTDKTVKLLSGSFELVKATQN